MEQGTQTIGVVHHELEMQDERNEQVMRDVEAVSQDSSGSGATLGESLRSLEVLMELETSDRLMHQKIWKVCKMKIVIENKPSQKLPGRVVKMCLFILPVSSNNCGGGI